MVIFAISKTFSYDLNVFKDDEVKIFHLQLALF